MKLWKRRSEGEAPPAPLEVRARHEACHAIVSLALDLEVKSLDVISEGPYGGNTSWLPAMPLLKEVNTPRGRADRQLEFMTVIVAPYVGTRGIDADLELSCSKDLSDARALASEIVKAGTAPLPLADPLTVENLLHLAESQAGQLLTEYRDFVDDLTKLLIDTGGQYKLGRHELVPLGGRMARHHAEMTQRPADC